MSLRKKLRSIFTKDATTRLKMPERDVGMTSADQSSAGHMSSDCFTPLPPEVVEHVLCFCHPRSLAQLRLVSRHLKMCVDNYLQHLPATAEMVRSRSGGQARDGEYNLAVQTERFGLVPLRVFCHNMAVKPQEYITLKQANYSELKCGGSVSGIPVRTTFRKVRVLLPCDGSPMCIACTDFTFADSTGHVNMSHGNGACNTVFDCVPYGVALNSNGHHSNPSRAEIDLRGTGLAVNCEFRSFGCGYSASRVSENGQRVSIEGGGYPGGCGPRSALDAHHATMNFGPAPTDAKRAWAVAPVIMRVELAGVNRVKDYTLKTQLGDCSWNDGARDN